jgi:thiamine transport system substrate-binding protein
MRTLQFNALILCMILPLWVGCTSKKAQGPGVQILTYSSLGSKGGFIDSIKEDFKLKTGCELRVETTLGAAQVLSYLEEEKQRARIDWVMGIDELLFERARGQLYLVSDSKKQDYIDVIAPHAQPGFYPLDYGALSMIYRKADFRGKKLPQSLLDLMKPEFKKKFIVQDPRASSPGMIFFMFTDSILKISDLRKQWMTLAPSWDSSYKMFLAKDAPMVWSYLTSLAYHASKDELDQYDYIDFKEGLPLQVEGMALVNKVGDPFKGNPCNEKFLNYVYQPEVQSILVSKQWMMPVMKNVALPKLFSAVPEVKKSAEFPLSVEKVDRLISRFGKEVSGDSL